jgi:hypothetical protein
MTKLSNFSGLYYDNKVIIFNLRGLFNYEIENNNKVNF